MRMRQLILQNGQQVRNDVQPIRQKLNSLIHLEVASNSLVDGIELWLRPHELWRVEDGALEVDVDAQDEEFAYLHVDLFACEVDFACQRDLGGYVFAGVDCVVDEILVQRGLMPTLSLAHAALSRFKATSISPWCSAPEHG